MKTDTRPRSIEHIIVQFESEVEVREIIRRYNVQGYVLVNIEAGASDLLKFVFKPYEAKNCS